MPEKMMIKQWMIYRSIKRNTYTVNSFCVLPKDGHRY